MSFNRDTVVHLLAGGCGGTMGAIITCPFEVVKTRLQSSSSFAFSPLPPPAACSKVSTTCSTLPNFRGMRKVSTSSIPRNQACKMFHSPGPFATPQIEIPRSLSLFHCFKYIIEVEGPWALWRGLGPNLVGVAPSRAIYFCTYSQVKKFLHNSMNFTEGPLMHIISASWAGFTSCTLTNPIWFIKTRLQLDQNQYEKRLNVFQCVRSVYKKNGISGFYKGLTASYYGISETAIHFVIYEAIKAKFRSYRNANPSSKTAQDFMEIMLASVISKTCASSICYPHEVARTRLREEGKKYYGFWQTLGVVLKEEGWYGLYRGLTTQLIRQIPNTAIMMATYEGVVYLFTKYSNDDNEFYEDFGDEND